MSVVVFEDATLLDGTGKNPAYPMSVVVEGEKIKDVVSGKPGSVPQSAVRVNCAGKTLMPGLIESHIHVSAFLGEMAAQTRNYLPSMIVIKSLAIMEDTLMQGFTSALDAGGADTGFRTAQQQGLVKGPRLQMCGKCLTQSGGHGDMRLPTEINPPFNHPMGTGVVADGVDQVRRAAREELRMGADYVKIMAGGGCASPSDEPDTVQYSLDEMKAAVWEAEAVGKMVLAHCYSPRSMQLCAEAGVGRVEHGNFMDEETAAILRKHNVIYVPTLTTYDVMSEKGEEFGIPAYFLRKMKVANECAQQALGIAVKAGLVIGSGADVVGPGQPFKGRELELKARVMGPMGAILSATKVNSEIMKISDKVGSIEPGKLADMLLLDGDPLKEISLFQNRDRIKIIMQGGSFIKNIL